MKWPWPLAIERLPAHLAAESLCLIQFASGLMDFIAGLVLRAAEVRDACSLIYALFCKYVSQTHSVVRCGVL